MNEQDLKSALQDVMVTSSPPPPMDTTAALEAGRRAHRRRRATWGGGVAALAVVGIAVGALVVPTMGGARPGDLQVAKPGGPAPTAIVQSASPSNPSVTGTAVPPPSGDTKTPWPNGQTDRTQTSGPRADKSVQLLADLSSGMPAGYVSKDKQAVGGRVTGSLRRSQSQFTDYAGATELWEYQASTPIVKKEDESPNVGRLFVQVETKGGDYPTDVCELTGKAWGIKGTCVVVDIVGKKVGMVTAAPGSESDFDQLAAYRHDDGTVVFVAQAKEYRYSGYPALPELPMTEQELAMLVLNPQFHLD